MINSDILTNQYIDTFLQSESSFLYAVINDDSLSKTAVKVEEGWYCNKHDIYKRVFTDMLNGFKYNIEKNVIPISMSKLIGELGVWAIAVKMPYGKTNEITVFPRFAQNQEETYWRGELDSKVFYEIQKIENKELKDKAGLMIPKFLKMFDETRLKLKTESNEIPDIYCYIFYPCYDISVFRGTISMATSKPIEPDRLRAISSVFLNKFLNRALIRVKSESLKSAVSAIMTRNMSHNLGSHYLHYTKTQLENLAKKGGEFGPDIRGAARVMGYMQGRMEYLATLVSGDRYPYGCVNFKSQIFDELTIDDFSKRHFEIEQGKNVSAIYDRIADIVDEIYENGCNEKIIKQYLPEIYEQSQKAKHDNSHNRTTNFLLTNLIFSEGFTRSNILDGKDADNSIKIHVRYGNEIFTGSSEKTDLERDIKERLSKINIALPGGILSCHAFFNIIENFIRNSAKYHRTTFQKNDNDIQYLTTTIRITEEGDYYKFTIYDNKQNALSVLEIDDKYTTLIESIRDRLRALHILDNDNSVDKNNKGFKEILFSTIWLRAFVYMHEKEEKCPNSYANVLLAIQSALDGDDKMQLIEKYGFKVIAVDDNGDECSIEQHRDENLKANLALQFTLPKYNRNITIDLTKEGNIDSLLNVYGDVVYFDESKLTSLVDKINDNLQKRIKLDKITEEIKVEKDLIFPRSTSMKYANTEIGAIEALKEVLHRRFGKKEFEKYQVIFGNLDVEIKDKYKIFLDRHLSTQKDMALFTKYAYADSISGGNFTITLTEMYNQWVKEGCKEDISEYYTILKIKESALTRITFIDERLYGEMHKQNMETELACRNIRVLNYQEPNSTSKKDDFLKLFIGNKFHRGGNTTHFLSIHLGLVEKIVQESKAFNSMSDESGKRYSEYNLKDRTIKFMDLLKKYFGDKNQKVFISIHSGRGNFSAELDGPLAIYPFIGMTAIENAYSNSKYLLCQLFYSTIYLGKGVANEHKNNQ